MILHADLPTVVPADLAEALAATPEGGVLLAPSHNGGTSLVAGDLDSFRFMYGPASFRRHLATIARNRSPHPGPPGLGHRPGRCRRSGHRRPVACRSLARKAAPGGVLTVDVPTLSLIPQLA